MERLRKTLSFRRKKKTPESSKPHQWQEDEKKVREGTCSFQVKYLGSVEVFESRGMQVCEEAVKVLYQRGKRKYQQAVLYVSGDALRVVEEISKNMKKATRFSFRKKPRGSRPVYATLYISGDSLRVVEDRSHMDAVSRITAGSDELNKGLIVDQTIEKVSFCAPDRNHDKAFAYICRDGTTRRWLCHAFLALKESGERLSHAVGCAFAVCLEKKQKREREAVQVTYSDDKTTFTRMGSFRQTTLTERMLDPQSAIVPEPVPSTSAAAASTAGSGSTGGGSSSKPTVETAVRERPQATPDAFMRLGSFREFPKLSAGTSPFKRQLSLRLNELPSNVNRQQHEFSRSAGTGHDNEAMHGGGAVGPAGSVAGTSLAGALTDPTTAQQQTSTEPFDPIAAMCQQLTQDLSSLTAASIDVGTGVSAAASSLSAPSAASGQTSHWPGASVQLLPPAAGGATQWNSSITASSSGAANGWQISTGSTSSQANSSARLAHAPAKPVLPQQPPPQQQAVGLGSYWPAAAPVANASFSSTNVTTAPLHRPTAAPAQAKFSAAASSSRAAEADPFDAAWAMRTTASSAANPFLPGAQQQHHQLQQHSHHRHKHTAPAASGSVTKTFEMKM